MSNSSDEEQSEDPRSAFERIGLKSQMKTWYSQFAAKQKSGFKHNSHLFNTEKNHSKQMMT